MTTEHRVRLSRASSLSQTSQWQAIIGTPALVPVPRKSSSTTSSLIGRGYNRVGFWWERSCGSAELRRGVAQRSRRITSGKMEEGTACCRALVSGLQFVRKCSVNREIRFDLVIALPLLRLLRRFRFRGLAVAVEAQLFQQLRRDVAGVLALGVAAATEESPAAAGADHHRLAALVAVDVGRDRRRLVAVAVGRRGVGAEDFVDDLLALGGPFLQKREQRLDLLEVVALELLHHLRAAALRERRAAEERAALAVAQQHRAAALLALHRRRNWLGLGRQRVALLVEVDDGRAARLPLLVLHRVAAAPEELAEAAAALDHVAAADGTLVLGHLAQRRLALRVDGLRVTARAVLAGEEEAARADAVEHLAAAF